MNPSEELLRRCCKDDRRAHLELYQMCFDFIFSVCRRYYVNREDVEASLNATFLKVVVGLKGFLNKEKIVPFELWVRRIAINQVTDEYRKNKSLRELIAADVAIEDTDAVYEESDVLKEALLESIDAWLIRLPPMGRAVFNLHVIDGYKHEEIAKQLGISVNTSKVHLHRAKKQLREWVKSSYEFHVN